MNNDNVRDLFFMYLYEPENGEYSYHRMIVDRYRTGDIRIYNIPADKWVVIRLDDVERMLADTLYTREKHDLELLVSHKGDHMKIVVIGYKKGSGIVDLHIAYVVPL
jgi:hypothetical protein